MRNTEINGLPAHLVGLLHHNLINGYTFGIGAPSFLDVAYRTSQNASYKDGVYFLAGCLPAAETGTGAPFAALLRGGMPIGAYAPDPLTGSPDYALFSVACVPPGASSAQPKVVGIGRLAGSDPTDGQAVVLPDVDGTAILDGANWDAFGNWAPSKTPVDNWPHKLGVSRDLSPNRFYAAGKVQGSPGATKYISYKNYNTADATAWTAATVPDAGDDDGYIKIKVSKGGYIMALTNKGTLDLGNGFAPTAFFTEDTNVTDIDYSYNDDLFVKIVGGDVLTAAPGWPDGGPVSWTTRATTVASGIGNTAWRVVAMDFPPGGDVTTNAQYNTVFKDAWYLICCSDGQTAFVTRNWTDYNRVPMPGIQPFQAAATGYRQPLTHVQMKFAGQRLFTFGPYGVSVSGHLGFFTKHKQ